jgi:hypothetical protein
VSTRSWAGSGAGRLDCGGWAHGNQGPLDLKSRMTTLEFSVGNLMAIEASHYAGQSARLDRVDARLERIERRLELAAVEPLGAGATIGGPAHSR